MSAYVSSDRTITFEGLKARLPWSWAAKHNVEKRIGKATVRIPAVELLLAYKFGAVFGRNINLKTGRPWPWAVKIGASAVPSPVQASQPALQWVSTAFP